MVDELNIQAEENSNDTTINDGCCVQNDLICNNSQIKTLVKQIIDKINYKKKNRLESIKMVLDLKNLLSQIALKNNETSEENKEFNE